jgi:hypothetical protein
MSSRPSGFRGYLLEEAAAEDGFPIECDKIRLGDEIFYRPSSPRSRDTVMPERKKKQ